MFSIIIPVHNQGELLIQCVESLQDNYRNKEIIIINDNSDQHTKDICKSLLKHRKISKLFSNRYSRGFSYSCNVGIELADKTAKYFCFLNSDTIVVTKNWIEKTRKIGDIFPKIGVLGPLSNNAVYQSIGKQELELREINKYGNFITSLSEKKYPKVIFVNGFCYIVKKEIIKKIGNFNFEDFPHYASEDDYSLMVNSNGYDSCIVDDVYVYHFSNKSYGKNREKLISEVSDKFREKWGKERINNGCKKTSVAINYLREKIKNFNF